MDKDLAPIKNRIIQFIEVQKINKTEFFKKIDVSPSNFRSSSLKSEINASIVAKISAHYPNLNINWLITGNGSMFLNKKEDNEYKDKYFQCLEEQNKLLHELNNLKNIHDSDQSIEAPKLKSKN